MLFATRMMTCLFGVSLILSLLCLWLAMSVAQSHYCGFHHMQKMPLVLPGDCFRDCALTSTVHVTVIKVTIYYTFNIYLLLLILNQVRTVPRSGVVQKSTTFLAETSCLCLPLHRSICQSHLFQALPSISFQAKCSFASDLRPSRKDSGFVGDLGRVRHEDFLFWWSSDPLCPSVVWVHQLYHDWKHTTRIGEASNPGPSTVTASTRVITLGLLNPTTVY